MVKTALSSTDIAKLSATLTGGGAFKRAATKEAAIKRFSALCGEATRPIDAAMILGCATFEEAKTVLLGEIKAGKETDVAEAAAKAKALREKTAGGTKPAPEKAKTAERAPRAASGDAPAFRQPEKVNAMMLNIMKATGPAKVGKFRAEWAAKDPTGYGKLAPTQQKGIMRKALNRLVEAGSAKRDGSVFSVAASK